MPLRAICFDLFDTLVDLHMEDLPQFELDGRRRRGTHPALYATLPAPGRISFEGFAANLARVDQELRVAHHAAGRELPTRARFRALTEQLGLEDPDLPDRLTAAHMRVLEQNAYAPLHHGEVLDRLKGRFRLALCSNFSHAPTAHRILAAARMLDLLDPQVISEDIGFIKPRPEIFRAVLDALDLAPDEVLHVGDRLEADVGGAAALGIRTAWITRRVPEPAAARAAYAGPPPDYVIADLSELPALLD